jgi:hypothetical protein
MLIVSKITNLSLNTKFTANIRVSENFMFHSEAKNVSMKNHPFDMPILCSIGQGKSDDIAIRLFPVSTH